MQRMESGNPNSELGTGLLNLISPNNLFQLINETTRYTEYSERLLDLFITDSPGFILISGTLPPISTSGHLVIYCTISLSIPKAHHFKRSVWDFKNANYVDLNHSLKMPHGILPSVFLIILMTLQVTGLTST